MEGWIMADIRTSALGGIPFGESVGRPAQAQLGQPYFNATQRRLELYTANGWQNIVSETPSVTGISGAYLQSNNTNTITVVGTSFSEGCTVQAIGTNGVLYDANLTTVNSAIEIIAVFSNLSAQYEPYDIRVTNLSNLYGQLNNVLYINESPIWVTPSGSLGSFNQPVSITLSALSATDAESSPITYSVASGSSLPSGISLNSSTGVISGNLPTISSTTTYTFTINASDGANVIPRTFNITSLATFALEYLVVAGGGGGAWGNTNNDGNGGGGAGGLVYGTTYLPYSSSLQVVVGTGGSAGPSGGGFSSQGSNGGNSILGSYTALGGGGGGSDMSGTSDATVLNGRNGGSGGGASTSGSGGVGGLATQPTSTSGGFGNNGGYANQPGGGGPGGGGGGGGGAGSLGGNGGQSSNGGAGGAGISYSITGSSQFYAAGGGGSSWTNSGGAGGSSIGGTGANRVGSISATAPVSNTGSGGGAGVSTFASSSGSAGVVVIAYPDSRPALTVPGTLTYNQPTRSGYRVYRFTAGSGTVTF